MKKLIAYAVFYAVTAADAAVPGYSTLISHRGESFDAPENTLPAFRTAVERGFGFECDVYLSKDGKVEARTLCSAVTPVPLESAILHSR